MAKAIPNPQPEKTVNNLGAPSAEEAPPLNYDIWNADNPLHSGLDSLAEDSPPDSAHTAQRNGRHLGADSLDIGKLEAENVELRSIIAELRQLVEDATHKGEQGWADRQKEYESLLEEKSEVIRQLHIKVKELEDRGPPTPKTPKEEELLALSEELERERCQLQKEKREVEEERRQLVEDEQTMTHQMREMEVQMARERADFARLRNELQRIHEEIRRELENAERNGQLTQRLGLLRQRYQEVASRKSAGAMPGQAPASNSPADDEPPGNAAAKKRDGGFFRGIFGG
jgi:hypothetical protein